MKNFLLKFWIPVLAFVLAVFVIAIDRITEHTVSLYLLNSEEFLKITPFLNLVLVENKGVSFGMLQNLPYGKWLLSLLSFVITGFFFVWLLRVKSLWMACSLGLIIGGALGNTFERLAYGHVIDILDFHIAGYHWPAFNLTDSAIFLGMCLLIFKEFFRAPEYQGLSGQNID